MAARKSPTDFLYASARIRAMENTLVGRERLGSLAEMRSPGEIFAALNSYGIETVTGADGKPDAEATLLSALRAGFSEVATACGGGALFAFLRYPYDCNNIKAILKCNHRGVPAEGMLIDAGTVPAGKLPEMLKNERYEELPARMGAAIPGATEAFAKTKNPQEIDLALDRACYADMAAGAGDPYTAKIVSLRADCTNILMCLRLLRMGATYPMRAALFSALLPGGTLGEGFFTEAFDGGESRLVDMVSMTELAPLFLTEGERTLSAVEKNADNLVMEFVKTAKFVPFGAEIPVAYLIGLETAVKNLRILLSGKAAGLSAEEIRGRLRESYV